MKKEKNKKHSGKEEKFIPNQENTETLKTTIENQRQAAAHHAEAAKHSMDAVKHYESGDREKAAHSTLLAHGHHAIAGQFLNDDAKHHAQTLKETNYK